MTSSDTQTRILQSVAMLFAGEIIFALPFIQVAIAASLLPRQFCEPSSAPTLQEAARQSASAQDGSPTGNMAPSLTSPDNFINFCVSEAALGAPIMNGVQARTGYSCNGIPMGMVPAPEKYPSCKFVFPINFSGIRADTTFNVIVKINNMVSGSFTNPASTYFSAPQQLSRETLQVIGHAHIVAQKIPALDSTEPLDPTVFSFFKGIDTSVGVDGTSTVPVPNGLPAGTYRLSTMVSASNHQPVLSGMAQRGSFDDVVYFTVS